MYRKYNSLMMGLKFKDSNDKTLLATEFIDIPHAKNDSAMAITEIQLKEGERLMGFKSGDRGWRQARHFDL